jgi:hypothetical protein
MWCKYRKLWDLLDIHLSSGSSDLRVAFWFGSGLSRSAPTGSARVEGTGRMAERDRADEGLYWDMAELKKCGRL